MKVQRTGTLLCDDVCNVKASDMQIVDYCYDYILLLAESTEITFRYGSHHKWFTISKENVKNKICKDDIQCHAVLRLSEPVNM